MIFLPSFGLFHEYNFAMFFSNLEYVEGILLFNFHHGSSQLNSLVEILKDLLLNDSHLLFFIHSTTNTATSVWIYCIL